MVKLLQLYLFSVFLLSCSNKDSSSDLGGWIGGEIVNPVSNFVIITKDDKIIDTIYLNESNRFLYRMDSIQKGLYKFIHNEYQILYLEPGDSLMIYVNTLEFDESLAFTGKGEERNKFLINMFLYNEIENQKMPGFYQLPSDVFIPKLDSMRAKRLKTLKAFQKNVGPCKDFSALAEANINYDYYSKKELYPFAHFGRNTAHDLSKFPKDYYNFRSKIDYNNKDLQSHYTYFRFLLNHFDYLAFDTYRSTAPFNSESSIHVSEKIKNIDSLVSLPTLKNSLTRSTIRTYLLNLTNAEEGKDILNTYFTISTDENHKAEMQKLHDATLKILPGNRMPNLTLVDFKNEVITLSEILTRPTVIYFWSSKSVNHYKNVHTKAEELRQKYPEFNFIALNTDLDGSLWKSITEKSNFSKQHEFRFINPNSAIDELVINTINKTMIIDKNGVIIENHTNMFRFSFEEELLGFLNQ